MSAAEQIVIIDATTAIDDLIFSEDPWYAIPLGRQLEHSDRLVRESLAYHLEHCPAYRSYYERSGAPGDIGRLDHIDRVPLVSTRLFKLAELCSVRESAVERWYRSSGTTGMPSRVPRDRISLERMVGSVNSSVGLIGTWNEENVAVVNLGPGREHIHDVWFEYVVGLLEAKYRSCSVVPSDENALNRIVGLLRDLLGSFEHVAVVGPPFYALSLCEHLEAHGQTLAGGDQLTVITAGGWKRSADRAIEKVSFRERLRRSLGLTGVRQVRDAFNQVELNTVFFECEAHQKHVPPWVWAEARDPHTLRPMPAGTPGMMSYLDASCTAFPCFLLTEDVGAVQRGRCECGREGTRVDIRRRLESRAAKGCALRIGQIHDARQQL
jgi:long-chain-fatty-acid---luciferin-component ligase